ncbi:TetR/AcrR family transcriptional regulator [Actibacterium sp. 188UL27-1]|uniref:TetR/AcrR family transcriptional regulator n=1 Tax=Actibacterium sp. 188UL27-1 TaxID=2786961 RepID=UPI00195CBAB3|nr:TetR/AcrR family transcriptional regulator [Actibacterium sp. 188UL27-1]MBM7067537.1 TetR/AcrR family transcriptional regulator [Actibacterium sp. 188UL27-1]
MTSLRKARGSLTQERVLDVALAGLRRRGAAGLSFRALAAALDVTPMAVHHCVGSRAEMLRLLFAHTMGAPVDGLSDGPPAERLRALMTAYCARAVAYAPLLREAFADPDLAGGPQTPIVAALRQELAALNQADSPLLDLLIDHAHGFALSISAQPAKLKHVEEAYAEALDWVIRRAVVVEGK